MSNKIRAYGGESATKHYKVAYNLTDADLGKFGTGFTLTNEGSIVEYNDAGFVTAIVCTDKNANGTPVSYVENPNEVNLGNMHNLDKNAVALVMGGTSKFRLGSVFGIVFKGNGSSARASIMNLGNRHC